MSKRPPNRYSKDSAHREYGISNWFRLIGIKNQDHQTAMREMFLTDFGFKSNQQGHALSAQKTAFINNRWNKFTQYVQKNYKFWLEFQYS